MDIQLDNVPPDAANAAVHLAGIPDISVIAVSTMGAGLILFVLFVLPVWLFLHYRSRSRHLAPPPHQAAVRPAAHEELAEIARIAERLEHRLDAVETLMDTENPRWRR